MSQQTAPGEHPRVNIVNMKALPIFTLESQKLIDHIKGAQDMTEIQHRISNWMEHMNKKNYFLQELFTKVEIKDNQLNKDGEPSYNLELTPRFKRFLLASRFTSKGFEVCGMANCHTDSFKSLGWIGKCNWGKKELKNNFMIKGHQSWKTLFNLNLGKPLDQYWVTDTNKFSLIYTLESGEEEPDMENKLFLELKGCTNRLKEGRQLERKTYTDTKLLKRLDLAEIGYSMKKEFNDHLTTSQLKVSAGTNFSNIRYFKFKSNFQHLIYATNLYAVSMQGRGGMIVGKNVPIGECLSRNNRRWMGERSTSYASLMLTLQFLRVGLLANRGFVPGNYVQMWVSRNRSRKIKVEAEAGICLEMAPGLKFTYSLFWVGGEKGLPGFGLKYEF